MGERPGRTRPGKELPRGGGLGAFAAASVAPGSWKREEDRAPSRAQTPGAGGHGELWTKEFSSWLQTKQLLL